MTSETDPLDPLSIQGYDMSTPLPRFFTRLVFQMHLNMGRQGGQRVERDKELRLSKITHSKRDGSGSITWKLDGQRPEDEFEHDIDDEVKRLCVLRDLYRSVLSCPKRAAVLVARDRAKRETEPPVPPGDPPPLLLKFRFVRTDTFTANHGRQDWYRDEELQLDKAVYRRFEGDRQVATFDRYHLDSCLDEFFVMPPHDENDREMRQRALLRLHRTILADPTRRGILQRRDEIRRAREAKP